MTLDIETHKQAEFEEQIKPGDSTEDALYCQACDCLITYEKAGINKNQSHVHICRNPQGIEYTIACFDEATGCSCIGDSYKEFSWFDGYSWQVCICKYCGEHMGWRFHNGEQFFGLIKDKLIRH